MEGSTETTTKTEWGESTYSHGNGGQRVETERTSAGAAVRDTQNRRLGHPEADNHEWTALLEAVQSPALLNPGPFEAPPSTTPPRRTEPPSRTPGRGLAWK
ncbi:DUF397 domain-containing protein [Nocardiopsis sp. RV163]|uniref:DUF397 domain-containing protein n=1 Tax=Nocardiopsis sp. RV163 TaxID=1661388 RepID=UPI0009E53424|nr:DUF397 domain-containing protein [Nocardiopsis sp. RV163]